ncbi:uncharacterized protein LOC106465867 [Limulus polyphemus]|uniref:Uncharacterized protein LOC106465867 n=1 Tax=Limulus polyphemus TaxID=6850 RepID=A0ABM1T0X6_LIMPO|nr:uncharacterized protein LOC106465867 [Limulus polyphemus]
MEIDEPVDCTVCNNTFLGDVNVKYPLRIIEPPQRHLPFLCTITFMANGGQLDNIVEIRFLSFSIGKLQETSGSATCYGGHLQILDSRSQGDEVRVFPNERFSKPISNFNQVNKRYFSVFNTTRQNWSGPGYFCGQMIGQSVSYISNGNNVTLVIFLPSRTSWRPQSFSLYLTYRFLTRTTIESVDDTLFFGIKETDVSCSREYKDCDKQKCLIHSPNFPGTYLRNITCSYLIKQVNSVPGFQIQIILFQKNEYKISIASGLPNSGAIYHWSLTSECPRDVVRVYDGPTARFPVIAEFCGSGSLAPITSSRENLLVHLHSVDYHRLHESRLELEVGVKAVPKPFWRMSNKECAFFIDGSILAKRQGLLESPQHTVPPNTTCTYILRGRSSYDRVWIYFVSYFVEDRHPWSMGSELCDTGKLELIGVSETASSLNTTNKTYCEKSFPPLCPHASDTVGMVPLRPCRYPEESILSSDSVLVIRVHYPRLTELTTKQPSLKAQYEFIDTHQPGNAVETSLCDRVIDGHVFKHGSLSSSRNTFHFGRGGRKHVTCSYTLVGSKFSRVIITITKLFTPSSTCQMILDNSTSRTTCKEFDLSPQPNSFLKVRENWSGMDFSIGCFCNTTTSSKPIELMSTSNNLTLTFTVVGMNVSHDFNHFYFEASYRFVFSNICNAVSFQRNGSIGELVFNVSQLLSGGFRCRWSVVSSYGKSLYLTFRGFNASYGCFHGNVLVIYINDIQMPIATVCVNGTDQLFTVDTNSVYDEMPLPKPDRHRRDYISIETFINSPQTIRLEWLELAKPSLKIQSGQSLRNINCLVRCPEINACISPDLWCDGTKHCPSGYDESPEHCKKFPVLYFAVGSGVTCFLLLLFFVYLFVHCRHRGRNNHVIRVPTFDVFELEGYHSNRSNRRLRY